MRTSEKWRQVVLERWVAHMEIKRIGENQIRCALTEEEIHEMGFDIDDIIGNTETTQKFMRVVLNLVEEKEQVNLDHISPMVRAELLQDHSMAITFGGESDMNFKNLVDTVSKLLGHIAPEKAEQFCKPKEKEKKPVVPQNMADDDRFDERVPFALEFNRMEDVIRMCSLFAEKERQPQSKLYKLENHYYLLMDFIHFSKEELRPLIFAAVEYDDAHFADAAQIAYVEEHGNCIVKNQAIETLMQL